MSEALPELPEPIAYVMVWDGDRDAEVEREARAAYYSAGDMEDYALSATVELVEVLEMVRDALYVEEPLGYYRLRESFDELQIDAAIAKFKGA